MKPGHPYLTEQLDEQRSSQRRLLSRIPDQWLHQAAPPSKKDYDRRATIAKLTDPHRLEADLRALAATRYSRIDHRYSRIDQWVAGLGTPFRSDDVWRFLDDRLDSSPAIANDLYSAAAEARSSEHDEVLPELAVDLYAAIPLLVWADELADDGYCDPRLAARQPPLDLKTLHAAGGPSITADLTGKKW